MKCDQCVDEGERSTVFVGTGTTTLMAGVSFYDESGTYHDHDPNSSSMRYRCTRGHEWAELTARSCPAGDFPWST